VSVIKPFLKRRLISGSYGATFLGWLFAAATNSHLIRYLNLGATLTLGALIHVVAHTLRCWTSPFGLYVVTFFLQAAGMTYNESHANTFVASIDGAHRLLGFIHAMYALCYRCQSPRSLVTILCLPRRYSPSQPLFATVLDPTQSQQPPKIPSLTYPLAGPRSRIMISS
jgi:hypothetical protein